MIEIDDCPHGLGPKGHCTICNGRDARERTEHVEIMARFPTKFTGRMPCGHFVEIGDIVARRADDTYVCGECAS